MKFVQVSLTEAEKKLYLARRNGIGRS